jgi:xanthine dehydrogenase large subunit
MSQNSHHDSAHSHVRGKSEFIDDRPRLQGELDVGLFYSPKAHAKIKSYDLSEALKVPGIVDIFSAKDFHHNLWGTIFQDQPLLADKEVNYVGEVIFILAAHSKDAIKKAIKKIKVDFEDLPAILSISDAIQSKSFIAGERLIETGNVEEAFRKSTHILENNIEIHGAEHFYLESQAAISYPQDNGQIEVHSSSQHPTEVQHVISHGLGIPSKDVICVVKRMGGAFGGKESQSSPIAAYAALVTQKTKRPARLILEKDDDMIITGKRNPFHNFYKVGFNDDGKIVALDAKLYSNGGAYADLSTSIMERAMLHIDNAYFIPNLRVKGQVCRTHFHPHTAFRGFGGPKGILTIERIIEEIAFKLNKDPLDIRKLNSYQAGADTTHYGQKVENNLLPKLFSEIENKANYRKRRLEIDAYNKKIISQKLNQPLRGLSITAVKFGISFTTKFLNQGNALINLYRDGTVQVSTGATEMGQGVYTRIATLVAEELGISIDKVRVMPTSTEKNANTSPTAASSGTDINGSAAVLACQKIKNRLAQVAKQLLNKDPSLWPSRTSVLATEKEIEVNQHFENASTQETLKFDDLIFENDWVIYKKDSFKKIQFSELCNEAYLSRVSLCEYSHYRIPNLSFNKVSGKGDAFLYFTQGVACSEVSVCLNTGEVKTLRSDILMDLGRPVSKSLDLGQISGAFVQGLGWLTIENLFYSKEGRLLSVGPSTYKIPSIHDIPRDFNIDLLENLNNKSNLRGTKAVGEPPLMLAISVWTAIQDALRTLPSFSNQEKVFPSLSVPATPEVILRKAFPDEFTESI